MHTRASGWIADIVWILFVAGTIVVEIKAVATLEPIHEAQALTYLKLGNWQVGLLMNFNVPTLKNGIRRIVNNLSPDSASSAPLR